MGDLGTLVHELLSPSRKPWMSPLWQEEYSLGSKVSVLEDDLMEEQEQAPTSSAAAPAPSSRRKINFKFSWRKLWRYAGPGWLMSLAYLDPGNLESNLQQGAYTDFELVWVLWWATVVGFVLQEMSARLGLVTGRDLAQTVRDEYPAWLALVIYLMMEIAVIGADIQEVVGSGIAFNLLTGGWLPVWAGCLITGVDTLTFLAVGRLGVRYLEAFVCTLIGVMSVCFFINWYSTGLEREQLLEGWVLLRMPKFGFTQAIGTLGAVIMPHNLYLHSGLVLSRKVKRSSQTRVHEAIMYSRIESAVALLLAFAINLSIVATNAMRFFAPECAEAKGGPYACLSPSAEALNGPAPDPRPLTGLGSACMVAHGEMALKGHCGEIGLENAGFALADTIGKSSLYVWAIGVLAAGQASTMVCTYSGQLIMNGCLDIELPAWKRVALTRAIALGPALLVAIATTSTPGALNSVNEYLNILQSVQLPFAMLPALHFAASAHLLGRFRSPPILLAVSTLLGLVVLTTNGVLVVRVVHALGDSGKVLLCAAVGSALYAAVCIRLVWDDLVAFVRRLGRLIGSSGTWIRYRCWDGCREFCCGPRSLYGSASLSGSASEGKLERMHVTSTLIEADASLEGELLGRLLTPEALCNAAKAEQRASAPGSSGSRTRQPRNLFGALSRAGSGAAATEPQRPTARRELPQAPPPLLVEGSAGNVSVESILSPTDSENSESSPKMPKRFGL